MSTAFDGTSISVLLGNGDGTCSTAATSTTSVTLEPSLVLVADFNQDGNLDIAAATASINGGDNVTLFLGNGDGTFPEEIVVPSPSADSSGVPLAAGDLNGDGKPDLIITGDQILIGNGDGTFSVGPTLTLYFSSVLALADLHNDQRLDLVAAVAKL